MEEARILGGLAFASAFFSAFFIGSLLIEKVVSGFKQQRLVTTTGVQNSVLLSLLRNGVRPFSVVSNKALKLTVVEEFCADVERVCSYRQWDTNRNSIASLMLGIMIAFIVLSLLASSSVLLGVALCVCLILGVNAWVKHEEEVRKEALRDQIPEALQSMKTCFRVGYSLPQVLQEAGKETSGVLSQIFVDAHGVLESGGTVSEALDYIKSQSANTELLFLATALEIQHKTGSSIQQVLETARESVTDEIELKRSLRTQTAQAKLSAQIITIMPFALIALFSAISPGFLNPFFESFLGIVMFSGALFMQLMGVMIVRKMLRIEVA